MRSIMWRSYVRKNIRYDIPIISWATRSTVGKAKKQHSYSSLCQIACDGVRRHATQRRWWRVEAEMKIEEARKHLILSAYPRQDLAWRYQYIDLQGELVYEKFLYLNKHNFHISYVLINIHISYRTFS